MYSMYIKYNRLNSLLRTPTVKIHRVTIPTPQRAWKTHAKHSIALRPCTNSSGLCSWQDLPHSRRHQLCSVPKLLSIAGCKLDNKGAVPCMGAEITRAGSINISAHTCRKTKTKP